MSAEYIVLSKSQKALQDVIDMSKAVTTGEQMTFNNLPASTEKNAFLSLCDKFNAALASGTNDKLTVKAMAMSIKSSYEKLIKGDNRKASSKYEKEVANLKARLLLGESVDDLLKKLDDKENTALYRKNLLTTDKALQALINAE
jgi:hypothetical protein